MTEEKPLKIEIEWKMLERISAYYEFPTVVFLLKNTDAFPEKTRNVAVLRKMEEFRAKLNNLFEEYLGDKK